MRVGLGQEYIAVLPGGPLTSGGWGQRAVGGLIQQGGEKSKRPEEKFRVHRELPLHPEELSPLL